MESELNQKQKEIDELYKKEGLSDKVLDAQIEINKLRHEHNITDKNKIIYKNYVQ